MKSIRVKIQAFGGFLTGMVLPNIGAFIAWGLLTALFMGNGYFPNETLDAMRPIMLRFMLPTLLAYTGGKAVGGIRGAVVGVIATFGVIASSEITMFIGAMIMGPLGGYCIKKFDQLIEGKVKSGFEMIVNNFSAGIIGAILAVLGLYSFGPMIEVLNSFFANTVQFFVDRSLLVILPIFTEPARMLFLNNAISQGIMNPMGIQDAASAGKSIFFLLSSNPGPGLGLLLAYWKFGKGSAKLNAPSAAIIHFFGGIHEMYFPYVLMKPILILATMVGWMCSNLFYNIFNVGLVAYPSPGSIVSYMLMCPKGEHFMVIAGVTIGCVISFLIASVLLKRDKKDYSSADLELSTEFMKELKGTKKDEVNKVNAVGKTDALDLTETSGVSSSEDVTDSRWLKGVRLIIFACDAGMGSSAMGASILRNKVKEAGLDIEVKHCAIEKIDQYEAQLVVCHKSLLDRAKLTVPEAHFVTISNFINAPEYDTLVAGLLHS